MSEGWELRRLRDGSRADRLHGHRRWRLVGHGARDRDRPGRRGLQRDPVCAPARAARRGGRRDRGAGRSGPGTGGGRRRRRAGRSALAGRRGARAIRPPRHPRQQQRRPARRLLRGLRRRSLAGSLGPRLHVQHPARAAGAAGAPGEWSWPHRQHHILGGQGAERGAPAFQRLPAGCHRLGEDALPGGGQARDHGELDRARVHRHRPHARAVRRRRPGCPYPRRATDPARPLRGSA